MPTYDLLQEPAALSAWHILLSLLLPGQMQTINIYVRALNIVYSKLEIELFSPCLRKALTSLPPSETDVLILVPDASQREV